ncbi:NAD(P)H-hydrate dehydratase [Paraferrimonas sedimenticola]|uniref:Bifunctional NAD(P)H-hydrate repair enzyme n=1 Tax=Paraferrimonas sedimenticola TaxID=375674 RepID=A0AA37RVT6_9GAMM|nr:NAD(P)H-hydrate dehydratase [Paraferrimonas sedimenticola]GLP95744.1 bifunctional NAD(P)H-hydrate repair enzyme [Paraferrimonas sedimenticola]
MPTQFRPRQAIYTAQALRAGEQACLQQLGISGYQLMCRAGEILHAELIQRWPEGRVNIVCGRGNNGGDAYVVARLLLAEGRTIQVYQWQSERELAGEAAQAQQDFIDAGGTIQPLNDEKLADCDLIVDGLLGNGFSGEPNDELVSLIRAINQFPAPVLAIDLPSGLEPDTGCAPAGAVVADVTVTLVAYKLGCLTGQARLYVGELVLADLGIGECLSKHAEMLAQRHTAEQVGDYLRPRSAIAHKGQHGRLTVIGGDLGMPGSVKLAAEAALRAGTGLVTVVSQPQHQATIVQNRPELMFCRCELVDMEVYSRLGWANVLLLGPGLGQHEWGYNLFKACLLSEKSMVLDADGLNFLAIEPSKSDHWILTPHPGEAARLLNTSVAQVEQDRTAAVQALQHKYGGVVLLKGPGTLIYDGQRLALCDVGNPGLAVAGSGDLLAGIISAMWAQGLEAFEAAVVATLIHGGAADRAATEGQRGMLPSDLLPYVRIMANP